MAMTLEEALSQSTIETMELDERVYFEINPETREIYVPEANRVIGVVSDEKTERLYFRIPKIVGDSIDLTKLNLRINYQNANLEKDQYIITDVTEEGENITFSWLLSRRVTRYKGKISFILCAVKVDGAGVIKNEWNTTLNQDTYVLEGMEVDEPEVDEEIKDVIAQLLELVNKKTDEIVEQIDDKGTSYLSKIETDGENEISEIKEASKSEKELISNSTSTQIERIQEEATTQKANISNSGTEQIRKVKKAGEQQINLVGEKGTQQIKLVGEEGKNQLKQIDQKVDEIFEDIKGDPGPYFRPSVSEEGDISWTNNGGLENPQTVNIRGPQGEVGPPFKIAKIYSSVDEMNNGFSTDEVKEGGMVLINTDDINDPDNAKIYTKRKDKYSFVVDLSGAQGIEGPPGKSSTIKIGTVEKGDTAQVSNSGTDSEAVLNFVLPKGDTGRTGDTGPQGQEGKTGPPGESATIRIGTVEKGDTAKVTNSGTDSAAIFDFVLPKGDAGPTGAAATITIGKVTTGEAGSQASVTNAGTSEAAIFNFIIPKGDRGEQGPPGPKGEDGETVKSKTYQMSMTAAGWTGEAAPYQIELDVEGVTETSNVDIIPQAATREQIDAWMDLSYMLGSQEAGKVIIQSWGDKPTVDIPIIVIVRGD